MKANPKFRLKNYTTGVPADKSIMQIEKFLTEFQATAIMKEYTSDGKVRIICFKLNDIPYKLPLNIDGVKNALFQSNRRTSRVNGTKNREERAYRVACRILKDWIHSQLSLILSGQAQPDEIMLPYIYDGKKTLYDAYREKELSKFILPEPKKEQ